MKRFAKITLMLVAGLAAGCSDDPETTPAPTPRTADELLAPGSFAVGFRQLELTYPAAADGADRTLPIRVWYPAVDGGEAAADYAVAGIVSVPTDGALAAPQLAEGGPFPLAIYSHGSGGEGLLGYPFGELFASHGWVVVAPSHVGNTVNDSLAMTFDPFPLIALNRPHDITAVLDWLEGGPGGDALAGQTRTGEVLLFGHSFGAYTTFAAGGADLNVDALKASCGQGPDCALYDDPDIAAAYAAGFGDSRIAAISPQSPALIPSFGQGELTNLAIPTMLQSARQDITLPHEVHAQPSWDALDEPADIWIDMQNAGHLSFISICHDLDINLVKTLQPNAEEDGCGPESTPTEELVPVLAAYLLGFGRQHILAEEGWDTLLRGAPLHPEIIIHTHE